MRFPERSHPLRMCRVAVVALGSREREVLVALARSGAVDLSGPLGSGEGPALEALRRLESRSGAAGRRAPTLAAEPPDVAQLERTAAGDLLAGEVELERRRASAVSHGGFVMFVGWVPRTEMRALQERLGALGAAVTELSVPRGRQPPTLLPPVRAAAPFRPLVSTYGAVPYADLDPTPFVAVSYCVMFGMMFGDVGDGLLIVLAALALRRARRPRLQALRRVWPMVAAAGAAATVFGFLYGEAFGPTGLVAAAWVAPLDAPTRMIPVAIALGVCLLVAGHAIGIVNRWREGGAVLALTAPSGAPGLGLLVALGLAALGVSAGVRAVALAAIALAVLAIAALVIGLAAEAGAGAAAGLQVGIGVLDELLRVFSNVVSFVRLAAFGLMHAAIGGVVLHAAGGLAGSPAGDLAAAALFLVGSAAAFALEGLVVAVQALRLEYYELFSRLFAGGGRPFRAWSLPVLSTKEA